VTQREDPLGRVLRFHHHAQWLVGVTDPAGGYTALGYDARGNLDAVATPDNAITRYAHDLLGRVVAITDPKGNVQRRELDLLGRVTHVHEPDGNERTLHYDREGNVVHAKDVHHEVRFTYTGMNRLASRVEAGTTVKFEYDTEEQLLGIINEHGHVYRFKLGCTGEVDEEHGFDGLMRRYTRDRAGRVTRVERPGSRFSSFKYDPVGRVIKVEHFDGGIERYAYRPDGELTHASNSEAALVFERDALGRVVKASQGEHWVQSEYDLLGLRTRMLSSLGAELKIERNVMGDVTELREAGGYQVRFERDLLGLELERSLPGGVKSRWGRDKLGRPAQHTVTSEHHTYPSTHDPNTNR
jgi:YD repeat-containing protein